jgi:polyphosphate kinase 2 (PPK2 family)
MTVDLADYEKGRRFDGDYDKELAALQKRLAHIQVAYIVHRRRAIIAFEGWDAAGKGGAIQRLTSEWDPRHYKVWPIAAPSAVELAHHFLWRFWQRLPGDGQIAVFDRTWYGRVLVERVDELIDKAHWRRAYDEINDFEHMQHRDGATIIKIFLHITQEEQDHRLKARLEHPWKRWKTGLEDYHNRSRRAGYLKAIADMFAETDTDWAPWKVIDGNDKDSARIEILRYVADRLESAVPVEVPPADPAVLEAARLAFGGKAAKD